MGGLARTVALILLAYTLGFAAFVVLLPGPAGAERTDAIVVLTGGAGRVERGLDLMRRGRADRMLISGVGVAVRPVDIAAEHDQDLALFECCIDLGRESVDTRSNASEVARWMKRRDLESLRVVTTDWHLPRARAEIAQRVPAGTRIVGDAIPSTPSFRAFFLEYNKYLLGFAVRLVGL